MVDEELELIPVLVPEVDNSKDESLAKCKIDEMTMPFEEVTAQVLAEESAVGRGFTSYDLISRTLHQLARDGNHELLALALDRLGDQYPKRIDQLDDQNLAPLHYAARYSHPFTVLTLLQRKAKVNVRGQFGLTPLHCAARYRKSLYSSKRKRKSRCRGNVSSMKFETEISEVADETQPQESMNELKTGDDEDKVSDSNKSLLTIDEDQESVVKVLVENGADIDARDIYGLSPLHYAAMRGHDIAAKELMAFSHVDIESRDKQLMTPLSIAATFGYVDICRLLIDKGADILASDESGQTPLHRAAAEGHLVIVELLLEGALNQGGEEMVEKFLSIQDWERQTPLHLAVTNGNRETTCFLLSKGAEVNAVRDNLATPLHAAAVVGDADVINLLIKHGANIEAVDSNQQTPLHKASSNNQVEGISLLLENGAKIEKRDKDSFTPLLLAASCGHSEAIFVLLENGAQIDVIDKDDKSVIMWSAQQGHFRSMKVLLEDSRSYSLIDFSDSFDNSPLHEASRNGYLDIVDLLLGKGSKIDNKNEDEETALHIASEKGQTEVVKKLIKNFRYLINDENEDGDSPLHLAAFNGHAEAVEVLLKSSADVEARNTLLWTPLDCASANGHANVCQLLIDYDSPIDPLDKTKTTPLQLAAQRGHVEVVELLLQKGAAVAVIDSSSRNALEIAVAAGQHDVAMAIVKSTQWLAALRNVRLNPLSGHKITPFRLLIQRFPDVATAVLDRCITTNGKESDERDYGIKFSFEFVDDTYIMDHSFAELYESISLKSVSNPESPYDENGKLIENAEPYTDSTRTLRNNHPLMLMVKHQRSNLLGHPVSVSLLKHKWTSYTRYIYYFNLIFYSIFLTFLTGYVCSSMDWNYAEFLLMNKNMTSPELSCSDAEGILNLERTSFFIASKWVVIVMTGFFIIRELLQICQARMNYIGVENLMEWICYVGALLLVIDWNPKGQDCIIREDWQWQVGSLVIFAAWINLVLLLRKLPLFGIYVVMFTDVFVTFSRFFVVFFLFIVGFALSFYMVFRTQVPFSYVGSSLLKTSVMMIGEFEFDAIFNSDSPNVVQYPVVSYILFVFFLVVMSILIMNLLVGLAVDDIKAVQDQAVLKRRAMQTQLIMDVEVLIPESLRRYFATSFRKFFPNQNRSAYRRIFSDFNILHSFDYAQVQETDSGQEELTRSVTKLQDQICDLKRQNQKMYSLFTASLAFHKRMKKLESLLLLPEEEQ